MKKKTGKRIVKTQKKESMVPLLQVVVIVLVLLLTAVLFYEKHARSTMVDKSMQPTNSGSNIMF